MSMQSIIMGPNRQSCTCVVFSCEMGEVLVKAVARSSLNLWPSLEWWEEKVGCLEGLPLAETSVLVRLWAGPFGDLEFKKEVL